MIRLESKYEFFNKLWMIGLKEKIEDLIAELKDAEKEMTDLKNTIIEMNHNIIDLQMQHLRLPLFLRQFIIFFFIFPP